jgi:hypothetical protein
MNNNYIKNKKKTKPNFLKIKTINKSLIKFLTISYSIK